MGQTLFVAFERKAYTYERSCHLSGAEKKQELVILPKGDPSLLNSYQVVQVNAVRWPR